MYNRWKQSLSLFIGGLIIAALLVAARANAQVEPPNPATQPAALTKNAAAVAPMLHYQGQLLDPATGGPKANATYPMTFRIYNVATGGTVLWGEAKNVVVTDGLFSTMLGDTAALNLGIFTGQQLWLSVQVGNDLEATPRQLLAYAPYALFSDNADKLDGLDASAFVRADQGGGKTPVAFGFVNSDGSQGSGTGNFSSRWRSDNVYEISINGEDYKYANYATVATPACDAPILVGTASDNGHLLVEFFNLGGDHTQCRFHFVVFKP